MQKTTLSIESQALALPLVERAELVSRLLGSLETREGADAREVKRAWVEVANRRYQSLISGEDAGQTHDEVFAELRAERH